MKRILRGLLGATALSALVALAWGCGDAGDHFPPPGGGTVTTSSGSGSSSSSSGAALVDCACTMNIGQMECATCFNAAGAPGPPDGPCRALNLACLADTGCSGTFSCMVMCKFGLSCINDCIAKGTSASTTKLGKLVQCVCDKCPACEAPAPSYSCAFNPGAADAGADDAGDAGGDDAGDAGADDAGDGGAGGGP